MRIGLNGATGKSTPPSPPPMRIGQHGDTIDRAGVRRKANGKLRKVCPETVINWMMLAALVTLAIGLAHRALTA
jgi:hypothetical protein